ncbi:hypothetical protein ARMGADRAFT_1035861 [Armillaria gallica]|uniref:Uncharacterized protein n=1 Tax=Armillaria gallica TaxID=47427 RepID=A0A2H3DAN9_ARMGA|nr:hypothetical protein ARMGADRAFT_1035861 [Armillaria gallica]
MKAVHYRWPMVIEAAYSVLHDRNGDQKAGRQGKETRREPNSSTMAIALRAARLTGTMNVPGTISKESQTDLSPTLVCIPHFWYLRQISIEEWYLNAWIAPIIAVGSSANPRRASFCPVMLTVLQCVEVVALTTVLPFYILGRLALSFFTTERHKTWRAVCTHALFRFVAGHVAYKIGVSPTIEELPDGAKLLWIGAKRVQAPAVRPWWCIPIRLWTVIYAILSTSSTRARETRYSHWYRNTSLSNLKTLGTPALRRKTRGTAELVPRITTWVPPRSQHLRMYSGEFSALGMNLWRLIFESSKGQLESRQQGNERDGCARSQYCRVLKVLAGAVTVITSSMKRLHYILAQYLASVVARAGATWGIGTLKTLTAKVDRKMQAKQLEEYALPFIRLILTRIVSCKKQRIRTLPADEVYPVYHEGLLTGDGYLSPTRSLKLMLAGHQYLYR